METISLLFYIYLYLYCTVDFLCSTIFNLLFSYIRQHQNLQIKFNKQRIARNWVNEVIKKLLIIRQDWRPFSLSETALKSFSFSYLILKKYLIRKFDRILTHAGVYCAYRFPKGRFFQHFNLSLLKNLE
jgi:hypothetical protein